MHIRAPLLAALLAVASPAGAASPFAGSWRGTWADAGLGQSGRATLTIDAQGAVTQGTVTNSLGYASPLTGRVADDGQVALHYAYTYAIGTLSYGATGQLRMAGGRLAGVLDFTLPSGTVFGHGAFTFERAPVQGPNTIEGGPGVAASVYAGAASTSALGR